MAPKKGKKGGKKGKKGGKKEKKEESAEKQALANENIWKARLKFVEKAKDDFKENAQLLSTQNDLLQGQMRQVELDTIDVITFLKTQDTKKNAAVEKLDDELKRTIAQNEVEKTTLISDYTEQIRTLQSQINKRQDDIVLMQNELKHVKEFRKKRVAMQRELDAIKDAMFLANKEHKTATERMTQKFEDEKLAMQQDTNVKISELADRAHQEAITNLDETTRSVYKENVRLTEAMRFHKKEADNIRKENAEFEAANERLRSEQDENEMTLQEKISHSQKQKHDISEAESKAVALEEAMNDLVVKFDQEQKQIRRLSALESESSGVELAKISRLHELKSSECSKVRKLARSILGARSDVEQHFLDSLIQAKEDLSYHTDTPLSKITISDLPWESREAVLRALFVKMNTKRLPDYQANNSNTDNIDSYLPMSQERAQVIRGEIVGADKDMTFLTQGDLLAD